MSEFTTMVHRYAHRFAASFLRLVTRNVPSEYRHLGYCQRLNYGDRLHSEELYWSKVEIPNVLPQRKFDYLNGLKEQWQSGLIKSINQDKRRRDLFIITKKPWVEWLLGSDSCVLSVTLAGVWVKKTREEAV